MLYLNMGCSLCTWGYSYLTLTNVVFEWDENLQDSLEVPTFNFNKCCIWIWEVEDLRKAGLI